MKNLFIIALVLGFSVPTMAQISVAASATGNSICFGESSTLSASASGATNYSWSPSTGLNTTNGPTVIASPVQTTTYTVTATGPGGSGSTTVTVTVNSGSFVAAGVGGGTTICQTAAVNQATYFRDANCNRIAAVTPAGSQPVSGNVTACVKVENHAHRFGTMDFYAARHFDIEPVSNAATATANVTLYFLQSEFNDYNSRAQDSGFAFLPTGPSDADGIKNIRVRQFHGTGTHPNNYTGYIDEFRSTSPGVSVNWNSTANWWEITIPVNGFSGFYLTTKKTSMPLLPIFIEHFRTVDKQKHMLSWKLNCSGSENNIVLERSSDGIRFSPIKTWTPDLQNCNLPFRYQDFTAPAAVNYYRLKVYDADGEISYSHIVTTGNGQDNWASLTPNITSGSATLNVLSFERAELFISISDAGGRKVKEIRQKTDPGNNEILINSSSFSTGMYFVHVNLNGQRRILRLMKQ